MCSHECSPALDSVKELFANAGFAPDIMEDEDTDFSSIDIEEYLPTVQLSEDGARLLQTECCAAFVISLLIRVKFFLKDMYLLDNEKCMTYQPANSSKVSASY